MSATEIHEQADTEAAAGEVWELLRTLFHGQRRRFLSAASELDLHPAQAGALLQLDTSLPMHQLATLLGCDNSNVTGLVDRLEARGFVSREPDAEDRRVKHVVLTEAGGQMRAELLARVAAPPEGLARLTGAEQCQLRALLRRVAGAERER
jgi:DNA-binding MarR family transcriptional regulator